MAARIATASDYSFLDPREREIVVQLARALGRDGLSRLGEMVAARYLQRSVDAIRGPQLAAERERQAREERAAAERAAERRRADERRKAEAAARTREIAIAAERRRRLLERVDRALQTQFLDAGRLYQSDPDRALLSADDFRQRQSDFVRDWVSHALDVVLDDDQCRAVASSAANVQVIARAGSGKTRTIVARAAFLQGHCGVLPDEVLLLAFNTKAAERMREELRGRLRTAAPHVMTFHALAHALVHPTEDLISDDASADQLGLSREIQEVIDALLRSPESRSEIRDVMLAYFREDWERIVEGRFELSMADFLAYRRSLQRESLAGEFVKSFGELVIANALFEHAVGYRYERNFHWDGTNYRPDFTILEPRRIVIEYFGLTGDPDYDAASDRKRAFWSGRDDFTFLELSSQDLSHSGPDAFVASLLHRLRELGIPCERRSEEEIWEGVRRRAVDRFTGAIRQFVGRARKLDVSPAELCTSIENVGTATEVERKFQLVGVSVLERYLELLREKGREDFDGLIWRAVALVEGGKTHFVRDKGRERGDLKRLRFVMIDEYQDFAPGFDALVEAIRRQNREVLLFCVGDDWQAINGFAGSEPRFFASFSERYSPAEVHRLPTNYRSGSAIVEAGNAVIGGSGLLGRAHRKATGTALLADIDSFEPTAGEEYRHDGDDITPAVLRIVSSLVRQGKRVVLLARTNQVPFYVNLEVSGRSHHGLEVFAEHVRSFLPEEDRDMVTASTVHRYKGLEKSAVVVLDALERRFPLIHPTWFFQRVFGDSLVGITEEERRLFYVAVTRAEDTLVVLTERTRSSPFLANLAPQAGTKGARLQALDWSLYPPAPSPDAARLEVRVFGAYDARDQLKNLNYRWKPAGKFWARVVPADNFSLADVLGQPWADHVAQITVHDAMTGEIRYTHAQGIESPGAPNLARKDDASAV